MVNRKIDTLIQILIVCLTCASLNAQTVSLFYQESTQLLYLQQDSIAPIAYMRGIQYPENEQFSWLDPLAALYYNTGYPRSYNDGPVWQGSGATFQANAGFQLKRKGLNITFYPNIYFSENRNFELSQLTPDQKKFNYPFLAYGYTDFVQRYGSDPFFAIHLGQSEIGFRGKYFQAMAGTQNFTLGPARYHQILMSNGAPGFPHINLGTPGKIPMQFRDIRLGKIEANVIFGLLRESPYFDDIKKNDTRYFSGLSFGYEIPYAKGLSIGLVKVMHKQSQYFEPIDLMSWWSVKSGGLVLDSNGDTIVYSLNDLFDQMASVFVEYRIPESDFRFFFEFARNDFNGSPRRFLMEFEHSSAFSLGIERAFLLPKSTLHIMYEHTQLARYKSWQWRDHPVWYSHWESTQGYTNYGQIMGAGIGPGGISNLFTATRHSATSLQKLTFQRIRFNEDYFEVFIPNINEKIRRHDVEYTFGLKWMKQTGKINYGTNIDLSYRFGTHFLLNNDRFNLGLSTVINYKL